MGKRVELPLIEPFFKTFQNQAAGIVVIGNNLSIHNWYLNETANLSCTLDFFDGRTTPDLRIPNSFWNHNPHLEKILVYFQFPGGYINPIIRNMLDAGYYVYFKGVDDYYIKGKSWYKERHILHDGLICGYDSNEKTYCIYAYDSRWVCQKFWTPQKCFDDARKAGMRMADQGYICALKPKMTPVAFSPEIACEGIAQYLDSSLEKYTKEKGRDAFGIIVLHYLAKYVGKLYDGSIPYERKDRRIFRMVWEHKALMLERIQAIEKAYDMGDIYSRRYQPLVKKADNIRMRYASYVAKRRDDLLLTIQSELLDIMNEEKIVLTNLWQQAKRVKEM